MLTVRAIRCVGLRDVAAGTSERQDPYVTLTLEENQKLHAKTDVCYAGGVNPQFNSGNWMRLPVPQPGMTCLVQVWDKHSQDADELIASGRIPLSSYDDDGTEEEPLSVDLYWQGSSAGKFHSIVTYDPPVGSVSAHHVETASQRQVERENWIPWLRLQITHRSGKVKDFVLSRTAKTYGTGREYVQRGLPMVREQARARFDNFRTRQPIEQSVYIAAAILLVVLPWPRAIVGWFFSSLFGATSYTVNTFYGWTMDTVYAFSNALATVASFGTSTGWALTTFMLRWAAFVTLFGVLPVAGVLFGPRLLGLGLTKIASMLFQGHLISFGTITFVPWMTDFRRLKFRVIVIDMLLGNPRDKGFTPRLLSFNRFEMAGSIALSDIWRTMMFRREPCPLSDVDDFQRLATVRVDHLEIDGLTINLEVNDKHRLNLLDLISEFDRAQVNNALAKKDINPRTFRFPNCVEVQVLGARNLRALHSKGVNDPYYTVSLRKQSVDSTTVVKTLNPAFPPRIEQFFSNDPSAVLNVELWDQNVGRSSDLIGKWITPLKWLLIDPNNLEICERDTLSEDERRQGWIGLWAPLVDENFRRNSGCGDVHLRIRWVYNPSLPDIRPGERVETLTPMQQLAMMAKEVRARLGDLHYLIDYIKHIPLLLDFEGPFVINDTLISLHDVLYGRSRERDNVVRKILVQKREETERAQVKVAQEYPRSLGVRETPAAIDRSIVQPTTEPLLRNRGTDVEEKAVDPIETVVVESVDPQNKNLPVGLDLDIKTVVGTGESGAPGDVSVTRNPADALEGYPSRSQETNVRGDIRDDAAEMQRRAKVEREMAEENRRAIERDPKRLEQSEEEMSTVRNEPLSDTNTTLKETIATEIGRKDRLTAVYPEKLVTSAPEGESGFVRGDLAELRKDLGPTRMAEDNVYLGDEEDDDAAEQRNADRYEDDERVFDQDGREFVKVRPIVWRKQFLTRHGDPGINLWKFVQRLIRGIIPKISADTRLQKAVAGSAIKSLFTGQMGVMSGVAGTGLAGSRTDTTKGLGRRAVDKIKGAAHNVAEQFRLVEKKATNSTQDAELRTDPGSSSTTREAYERRFPERVNEGASTESSQRDYQAAADERRNYQSTSSGVSPRSDTQSAVTFTDTPTAYAREPEHDEEEMNPDAKTTRPVHGQDADFSRSDLVIAGGLEAVWQGRHRITSLFRRWKPWHVEIKGDTVFYHRTSSSGLSSSLATDATWYTLDLTWLQEIYLTDSSRVHNNELVLRFVQDDSTLHFRLPTKTSTPSLEDWLGAFKRVQSIQQQRRRLGTNASDSDSQVHSTGPWPGEDLKPQQRQRGSSLTTTTTTASALEAPLTVNKPGYIEIDLAKQQNLPTKNAELGNISTTTDPALMPEHPQVAQS